MRVFRRLVAVSVLGLLLAGPRAAYAVPISLLTNTGAEAGDFTGWDASEVADEPWTISSTGAHGGTKSFVAGNDASVLKQLVDLVGLGYTTDQLDSITGISLSGWVKNYDDDGEADYYDIGLQMLGEGLGAMAITSLGDPHDAPADWTQRSTGLGSYGPGMRYIRVLAIGYDGTGDPGNHGPMFDDFMLQITDDALPTMSGQVPANGARNIESDTGLSLTFSEKVTVNAGDIVIYRASTAEAVATIDITSEAVTGSGTDTIAVTLPVTLPRGDAYYVNIDEGALVDAWENPYAGLSTSTDWTFRTKPHSGAFEIVPRIFDYSVQGVAAEVGTDGGVLVRWQAGGDVPLVRIFAQPAGSDTWQKVSDFLSAQTASFAWQLPDDWRGTPITFLVESTDLSSRLASAMAAPVTWSSLMSTPPTTQPTELVGRYIRTSTSPTVYAVDGAGQRRPLLNADIFYTWEASFDVVEVVDEGVMADIPLGPPLLPKPGVKLIKIQSVPRVYIVDGESDHPVLRWIPSEEEARRLYGDNWQALVLDVPPTLWKYFSFAL